jgi:hypothetical protein
MYRAFPGLRDTGHSITSPATPAYNCIAWAAGDDRRFWWPQDLAYWPQGAPRELTLEAFVRAYRTVGYDLCEDGTLEAGYEKIAIYAKDSEPTHAARQLPTGEWTSKLGREVDISHATLSGLQGDAYGTVVRFMRRARQTGPGAGSAGHGATKPKRTR